MTTSKKKLKKWKTTSKKMEDDLNNICFKLKTNQSTKINLIGCDTIVNLPSIILNLLNFFPSRKTQKTLELCLQKVLNQEIHHVALCILWWVQDIGDIKIVIRVARCRALDGQF